jgi:hypothetical protein
MRSLIQLFNTALARLGGDQLPENISSLEESKEGLLCKNLFVNVLDNALVANPWSFAKKRKQLALLPDTSSGNSFFLYRYELPGDCLRPVRLDSPTWGGVPITALSIPCEPNRKPLYEIEGRTVLCNLPDAWLVYISRVEDPAAWPPTFADALAWALAGDLATGLVNDVTRQQNCYANYQISLAKAIAQDRAMQNPQPKLSPWEDARHGGFPRCHCRR